MATEHRTPAGRPPAPGTHATLHLLIGDGRMPVVTAQVDQVVDRPIAYLRLAVDDMPRSGTRHVIDVSISGPPADVTALVAELSRAIENAEEGA